MDTNILSLSEFKEILSNQSELFDFSFGFIKLERFKISNRCIYNCYSYTHRVVYDKDNFAVGTHNEFYIGALSVEAVHYLRTLTSNVYLRWQRYSNK